MRKRTLALVLAMIVAAAGMAAADAPEASDTGKLWGLTYVTGGPEGDDQGPDISIIYDLYEKSRATVVFVGVDWGNCEKADPAGQPSVYDWSSFDSQIFMKSSKTKICWVGLGNEWAEKIRQTDPERYWKLAEDFVTAFARHANSLGIRYFQVPGNEFNLLARADWALLYVEPLKHIHKALKAASPQNVVIAGNLSYGGDEVVQALYDAGIKGHYDVLDIHAYSYNSRSGVDVFQVIAAHRAMARNGDGDKQIFLGEGWGPARELPDISRASHKEPATAAEIDALRWYVENGYRNLTTERDIYDPDWVLGARFFTMNDNYGQGQWKGRAKKVDENADGTTDYILLDGYRFPPDFNIEPKFFNGGLVDFEGKPKDALLDGFPPVIPKHEFTATLAADTPVFNYVAGRPYRLELKISNLSEKEMKLEGFGLRSHGGEMTARAVSDKPYDESLDPGEATTAFYEVTFKDTSVGRQVTLIGELEYSVDGVRRLTDCWATVLVTSQFEITLLPARAILNPAEGPKRIGMSVINHSDAPFAGKVTFSASAPMKVEPAEVDMKIDPHGLEAAVFSVSIDAGAAPGHYAVFVDVDGKAKDWVAVDVPAVARKLGSPINTDGKLGEWADVPAFAIARVVQRDGKPAHEVIGKGRFAYDDAAFYVALSVEDAKHVQAGDAWTLWNEDSVQMGFDALLDGARVAEGGFRADDYEYGFASGTAGMLVGRSQAPAGMPMGAIDTVKLGFSREGTTSRYEIAFPWSDLAPFVPGPGKTFAASVLVNNSDGSGRSWVEWGGGLAEGKDPRKFIPVVLQ